MLRHAAVAVLPGLALVIGACGTTPPQLLPPPVASAAMPLPSKMSTRSSPPVLPTADSVPQAVAYTCEPDAAPRFDDPNDPNAITNKACGFIDEHGHELSGDPWIDGQLIATSAEESTTAPSTSSDHCDGISYEQCYGTPGPPSGTTSDEPTATTTPEPTTTTAPTTTAPEPTQSPTGTPTGSPTTSGTAPTKTGAPTTTG